MEPAVSTLYPAVPVARCFYVRLCIPTADTLVRTRAALARLDLYNYHKCVRATMIRRDACDDRSHRAYLLHTVMDGLSPRHMHARPIQHIISHTLYLVHAPVSQFSIELDRTEKPSGPIFTRKILRLIDMLDLIRVGQTPPRGAWKVFRSVSSDVDAVAFLRFRFLWGRGVVVHPRHPEVHSDCSVGGARRAGRIQERFVRISPVGVLFVQTSAHFPCWTYGTGLSGRDAPSSRLQPPATDFYSLPAGSA